MWAVASCTSSPQRQSDSYFVLGFPFPFPAGVQEGKEGKEGKMGKMGKDGLFFFCAVLAGTREILNPF